jgi:vancomycin resistance protein YoaR
VSTTPTELQRSFSSARDIPWRAFALAFLITGLALAAFAAVFAMSLVALNAGKVVPGTIVAGVPLGGLDRASAEVRLREQLPSLSSGHISVAFGDTTDRIEYADFGRDYDMQAMLDQAFAVGRSGDFIAQAQEQLHVGMRGATIDARVKWDEQALEKTLYDLAMAAQIEPIDATIVRNGPRFAVTPSATGTTIDVSSAWQQALATVGTLSAADTSVSVEPAVSQPAVTTEMAQLAVDRVERVAAADITLSGDGVTQTLTSDTIRGWIRLEPSGTGKWDVVIERDPVTQAVSLISASVYKAPVDASFKFDGGNNPVAVPGATGRELDVATTSDAVYNALVGRADGTPASALSMTINSVDPTFTTAQAIALAPKVKMISAWTTGFIPSERNFQGANIVLPARIINGTVVSAGGRFGFWETVGSLADIPGIGQGGVIKHGRTFPTGALGGGICSCSTTLWNAAMRAGLDMGARQNHDYYIDRYPTGLDATVWRSGSSQQNMTFRNDTDYPIIIRGYGGNSLGECSGLKKEFGSVGYSHCVVFQIWSIPNGRTVSYSKPAITNVKVATDVMEYADKDLNGKALAPGALVRVEYPTNGFWSTVIRTVRDSSGNIIHQDTVFSKYVRVTGLTLVGRAEGDPRAGTRFPNPNPFPNFAPPGARSAG